MKGWTEEAVNAANAKHARKAPEKVAAAQTQGERGKGGGKGKKAAKAKGISESQLQQSFFKWFRAQYPDKYWQCFAIPNGGLRNEVVAAKLKREGAVSGVWDVLILNDGYGSSKGLFIEFKVGYNKLTQNQEDFRRQNDNNYDFRVCYSLETAIEAVTEYFNN